METVFSVGSASRLYNEDPRLAEIKLRWQSKMIQRRWQRVQLRSEVCEEKALRVIYGVCSSVRLLQFLC
jgi:hypothetical protein